MPSPWRRGVPRVAFYLMPKEGSGECGSGCFLHLFQYFHGLQTHRTLTLTSPNTRRHTQCHRDQTHWIRDPFIHTHVYRCVPAPTQDSKQECVKTRALTETACPESPLTCHRLSGASIPQQSKTEVSVQCHSAPCKQGHRVTEGPSQSMLSPRHTPHLHTHSCGYTVDPHS